MGGSGTAGRMGVGRVGAWGVVGLVLVAGSAGVVGCASKPPAEARTVTPVVRDVHPLLRGTVGSEVSISGVQPVLVSGFGLVVGLRGTGGRELREDVAATMEREMARMGIGRAGDFEGTALEGKTVRQVLRDPNVAVVIVQAAVPPGAPEGTSFDVFVTALNAESLDGGRLWTTDLRLGPPSPFGSVQGRIVGSARGGIFVTPYARGREAEGVDAQRGRVLEGGVITEPFGIGLTLDNENHARARAITSAINSRFGPGPGDRGPTARGRSGSLIELTVPEAYRRTPAEFLQLVIHLPIDQSFPQEQARRWAQGLGEEPALAESLSWGLEAIGTRALPAVRPLYESADLSPQLGALKAGARLGDVRAAGPLLRLAKTAPGALRAQAIELLGRIDAGPTVDAALKELLAEEQLVVRVAAYEALVRRAELARRSRLQAAIERDPDLQDLRLSSAQLEQIARETISSRMLQGIDRRVVGGKFILDMVPGGEPLVYIAQQGTPRIVLFGVRGGSGPGRGGAGLIRRPMVTGVWDDRMLLAADEGAEGVRVMYRSRLGEPAVQTTVEGDLPELVMFLARSPDGADGDPGLGLTYSETVAVLEAMSRGGGTSAAFATERDRLQAAVLAAGNPIDAAERPETPDETDLIFLRRPTDPLAPGPGPVQRDRPQIQPIEAPTPPRR